MQITQTFEPIRPIYAPSDASPYGYGTLFGGYAVIYGESYWCSRSYLIIRPDND